MKIEPHKVELLTETSYYTMRRIYDRDIGDLLMVFVHLPSKLQAGDDERKEILREVKFEVEQLEGKLKIDKTLVVGDFNVNPFEDSMVLANSLHALPIGEIVKRKERRTVNGKAYSMFYNPMWSLMGDFKEPAGTYYYPKGGLRTDYWNIFDQVVLRPTLVDKLNKNTINIIYKVNDQPLIKDGKPIDTISDHLPIFFELGGWDNE